MAAGSLSGVLGMAALALSLGVTARTAEPGPNRAGSQPANGTYRFETDGCVIRYEIRGSGPVLMTVPNSWGLSHEGLRGLYRELEKAFTMVYFDPRGMGGSSPVRQESDMGMAAVREDFHALRRHLGLEQVAAIGWSNGAINLILLAAEHPESLRAAVFVHGLARFGETDEQAIRKRHPQIIETMESAYGRLQKSELPPGEADRRIKRLYVEEYFPAACADPDASRPRLHEVFDAADFSWRHAEYAAGEMPVFDLRPRLASITVPSLVIAGAHDILPPDKVREIHQGIRGSVFEVFACSGHFAPIEEPAAFAKTVRDFLSSAFAPPSRGNPSAESRSGQP